VTRLLLALERFGQVAAPAVVRISVTYWGAHLAHVMPSWPQSLAVGVITIALAYGLGRLVEVRG